MGCLLCVSGYNHIIISRHDLNYLRKWKDRSRRKPLILRGARQVGKTEIVRQLGKEFDLFIEFNFDEFPAAPDILPLLHYFYEKVPQIHVIAAGLLLRNF